MTVSTFPANSILAEVSVYDVEQGDQLVGAIGAPIESLAECAVESGTAEICAVADSLGSDVSAAIAIPIHRDDRVVSVAVLSAKSIPADRDEIVGVFECWEPVGAYAELGLRSGFYGKMERFENVSKFVRFEKGSGLPGQVWQERCGVIHDDLANHPGFLRAAGASADLLQTAIGIPVAAGRFHGVAVLISSGVSPIARACEVWQADDEGFRLLGGAYQDLPAHRRRSPQTRLSSGEGLPGLAGNHGGAVMCSDPICLQAGFADPIDSQAGPDAVDQQADRGETAADFAGGLAIPFFDGDKLFSVTTLLF